MLATTSPLSTTATLRIPGGSNALNNLPDRVPGVDIEVPKDLQRWYDGNTTVTLPSGRQVKPCAGCFLKYNVDAFRGRTVTGPNGTPIADIFWYGNAAATYGDIRSNPNWNLNLSLDKTVRFSEKYSLLLSAQATNALNHTQWKPGVNMAFAATSVAVGSVGAPQNPNNFGTYTNLNTYDGRQLELAAKFRF